MKTTKRLLLLSVIGGLLASCSNMSFTEAFASKYGIELQTGGSSSISSSTLSSYSKQFPSRSSSSQKDSKDLVGYKIDSVNFRILGTVQLIVEGTNDLINDGQYCRFALGIKAVRDPLLPIETVFEEKFVQGAEHPSDIDYKYSSYIRGGRFSVTINLTMSDCFKNSGCYEFYFGPSDKYEKLNLGSSEATFYPFMYENRRIELINGGFRVGEKTPVFFDSAFFETGPNNTTYLLIGGGLNVPASEFQNYDPFVRFTQLGKGYRSYQLDDIPGYVERIIRFTKGYFKINISSLPANYNYLTEFNCFSKTPSNFILEDTIQPQEKAITNGGNIYKLMSRPYYHDMENFYGSLGVIIESV